MADAARIKAKVRGRVKGIGFRAFTSEQAKSLGLTGYVRNVPGERSVEVEAEGDKLKLDEFLIRIKKGPALARVESVEVAWEDYKGQYPDFSVRS